MTHIYQQGFVREISNMEKPDATKILGPSPLGSDYETLDELRESYRQELKAIESSKIPVADPTEWVEGELLDVGDWVMKPGDWYCPNCESYLSNEQVTFEERHQTCGASVYVEQLAHRLPAAQEKEQEWFDVRERPLFTINERGTWVCTEDGDKEFIAAVPYNDSKKPGKDLWWIRHCVIEDTRGLCVVGDDDNEIAGWDLEDITHWKPVYSNLPTPPSNKPSL